MENFAAAAKSLQSCPTLCDPIDGSPPGPPSLGFSRQEHWSGCHFLLQCVKVKSESEVAQLCPTLKNPMDCSPPGSSTHGIFQARVLECSAIAFSIGELYPSPIRYYHLIGAVTEYSTGDSIVLSNQMRNVVRLVSSMNR